MFFNNIYTPKIKENNMTIEKKLFFVKKKKNCELNPINKPRIAVIKNLKNFNTISKKLFIKNFYCN